MREENNVFDYLLTGGRVIDPETGLDALKTVGIKNQKIAYIESPTYAANPSVSARVKLDVSGMVITPGFIDLHSHAQTKNGLRLQALDGVTTALELESGALPVKETYEWAAFDGRPINYGFSAGWLYARMQVLDGIEPIDPKTNSKYRVADAMFFNHQHLQGWRRPATAKEVTKILDVLEKQINAGAIGIGALLGYATKTGKEEFKRLAAFAKELEQPIFVHARYLSPIPPHDSLSAVKELVEVAKDYGTHIHLCHMNSTSGTSIDAIADTILSAREDGANITTEAYPYGQGMTAIGAEFLDPKTLEQHGFTPSSITYLPTGERVADKERLQQIREQDPGGSCLVHFLDENNPEDFRKLMRSLTFPGGVFASDAIVMNPSTNMMAGEEAENIIYGDTWPIPNGFVTHPRSTGCYARVLSLLVRETDQMSLFEAVSRSSFMPAQILEPYVPAMRNKGRVQVGADADIVVFNPASVKPHGDYTRLGSSTGFAYVFVGGQTIVANGTLQGNAFNGEGVIGKARSAD